MLFFVKEENTSIATIVEVDEQIWEYELILDDVKLSSFLHLQI